MSSFTSKVPSGKTISVRIIDSTSSINKLPVKALMGPPVPGFDLLPETGTWSFLIEHDSGRKLLFDLGIPTDWRDMAPVSVLGNLVKLICRPLVASVCLVWFVS